jgi:hypothetical protein
MHFSSTWVLTLLLIDALDVMHVLVVHVYTGQTLGKCEILNLLTQVIKAVTQLMVPRHC